MRCLDIAALGFLFFPYTVGIRIHAESDARSFSSGETTSILPRQVETNLVDDEDIVYMANVTIGGVVYPLQLDTGSSDLWVRPNAGGLAGSSPTALNYNISYSIGYAYGAISTAPVTFAGLTVPTQALLDVSSSNNPIFNYNAAGILGLGFNSISNVYKTVTGAGNPINGQPFLYNVFAQNSSQPNFIAFQLERKNGLPSDTESSFAIGGVEPSYQGVLQTQEISTWPVSQPGRWTIFVDGYEYADGVKRPMNTTVAGAPSALLLLDTGASFAYAPPDVANGLYSGIQGASFNSATGQWVVPCDQEVNFALWIAGRKFDWHPLDVVVPSLATSGTCVGSIMPSSTLDGFDFHGGAAFLRALYTILDFGDYGSDGSMGDPYVRLWSLIDQPTASAEFHSVRGGTPQSYTSSSTAPVNAAVANPDIPTGADDDTTTSTTVSADQNLVQNVNTLVSYMPIMLGVLGLNAVLLIVLCGFAIAFMCKRRKGKKGRLAVNVSQPSLPSLGRSHSYQKVHGEDIETPRTPAKFSDAQARAPSAASLKIDTSQTTSLISPEEAEITAVGESFRMSALGKEGGLTTPTKSLVHSRSPSKVSVVTTPISGTFRPSGLSNMSLAESPESSPTKSTSGQDLMAQSGSPARSLEPLPPAGPSASNPDLVSSGASVRSHQSAVPQLSVAPPGGVNRTEEHLAAMEARAAFGGTGDSNRRNTFQYNGAEALDPPTRRFQGADAERRALSTYIDDGRPREPLQRPVQLQDPPAAYGGIEEPSDAQEDSSATWLSPAEVQPPAGPSRSQEYLAAMEARRAGLTTGQQDASKRMTYHDAAPVDAVQTPARRFRGAAADDGRRVTYVDGADNSQRETVYFDAAGSPHSDGTSTPTGRGPYQSGTASPTSPLSHRSALPAAAPEIPREQMYPQGGNASTSSPSPSRSAFPGNTLTPPSNLRPSRLGASGGSQGHQARPGSYAGYSNSPSQPASRMPSNLGPQGSRLPPSQGTRFNSAQQYQGEEDLGDQMRMMRRPSFEERADGDVDAFADSHAAAGLPRPPRAPFANPGYRYSTA